MRPPETTTGETTRPDDVLAEVEREVTVLFRRANLSSAAPLTPSSLERSAYQILLLLKSHGTANINTLAVALLLDASTVTRQVVAMEQAGLIERRRDEEDRRSVVVHPTGQGLEELANHRRGRADLYAQVLHDWNAKDRTTLARMLHRLNESLDAYRRDRSEPGTLRDESPAPSEPVVPPPGLEPGLNRF